MIITVSRPPMIVQSQYSPWRLPPEVLPNYFPPSWNMLNGSAFGPTDNFMEPADAVNINGIHDSFSQRTADSCTPWSVNVTNEQPFEFSNIIIVGNAQCASTCAAFTTLMQELHGVKIVNFGAAKGAYAGMSGAEVLEWDALDSEVRVSRQLAALVCRYDKLMLLPLTRQTANLKDSPLAGPDLFVNGNFRHNWR